MIFYTEDRATSHFLPGWKMSTPAPIIPLTPEQKASWLDAISTIHDASVPQDANPAQDPHKRVYFVAFDGTWNDRNHLKPGETPTNPAQLETELSKHYDGAHLTGKYYPGVGTQEGSLMMAIDGATGYSAGNIAEQAYTDFEKQAQSWISQDPKSNIEVVVVGFSRGSASARHFMNLVDERGIPAGDSLGVEFGSLVMTAPSYLRSPGSIGQEALLYDTVATGQEHFLKLGIPDSVQSVVHLTAANENRVSFPLLSAKNPGNSPESSRIVEFGLPGAHSDIGGGYPTGPDKMSKFLGDAVLQRFGLPVTPGVEPVASLNEGLHDSQWQATQYAKPIEEALHGPGREVQTVHTPTAVESFVQNATEAAQYSIANGKPIFNAASFHTPGNGAGSVEVTNDGKGNISVISSVADTHLDLKNGVLNVAGEPVKLSADDIAAITHGKGIIFNVDPEFDTTMKASPVPVAPAPFSQPSAGREMSR
jgi:hypothetical protein